MQERINLDYSLLVSVFKNCSEGVSLFGNTNRAAVTSCGMETLHCEVSDHYFCGVGDCYCGWPR